MVLTRANWSSFSLIVHFTFLTQHLYTFCVCVGVGVGVGVCAQARSLGLFQTFHLEHTSGSCD